MNTMTAKPVSTEALRTDEATVRSVPICCIAAPSARPPTAPATAPGSAPRCRMSDRLICCSLQRRGRSCAQSAAAIDQDGSGGRHGDIAGEEKIERPVEGDTRLLLQSRQL